MKTGSAAKKDILSEYWDTPVAKSKQLWLLRQLFTSNNVYFFFQMNYDSKEDEYHVLTINGDSPFKITEEGLGWNIVGDLIGSKIPSKGRIPKRCRTFKVWNTPFAKKSFGALPITKEEYEKKKVFQYLIYTQDSWIEFVTFYPLEWKFHKGIKLDKLLINYLIKKPNQATVKG